MPAKNTIKYYLENGYYHIYNRGVEKRIIFDSKRDCAVFLRYLKLYLLPKDELKQEVLMGNVKSRFMNLNLSDEIELIAFALMPNHFHLLIKQHNSNGMEKFMRRLVTAYSMYFNRKNERIGPLFQGAYKAALIETDEYLLHLTRYIHLNPRKLKHNNLNFNEFSSYLYYLGEKKASWINHDYILEYFQTSVDAKGITSYKEFVETYDVNSGEILQELVLEEV